MQLEQSFSLPLPPARAWPAFKNVSLLVECLPGASLTGPEVEGKLPLRFDVKLGPIAAGFVGTGSASFDDAGMQGSFEGQAADKRTGSRVRGTASFALQPQGEGTRVQVTVDYTLTGALAQFSRGALVRELSSALTAQFAARLAERLQAPQEGAPAAAVAAGPAPGPAPVVPLDAWSLIKRLIARRWAAWLHRRPRTGARADGSH
jgi:carbon monoxide dehydrogenase subunit G